MRDIREIKEYHISLSRDKIASDMQDQRSNPGHTMTLHTYNPLTNVPTKCQLPTPYGIRNIAKVSTSRSNVLPLHTLANVSTQYQLPASYSFRDIPRTRFYRSRSHWQGQRSNQGQTMTLHTYTYTP